MLRRGQWNPPTPEPHQVWISLLFLFLFSGFCNLLLHLWVPIAAGLGLAAPSRRLCLPPETPPSLLPSPEFLGTLISISPPRLIPLLPGRCPHVSQTSSCSARSPVFCPFLLYTRCPRDAAAGRRLERCKVGVTPRSRTSSLCMGL